MEAQALNCPTCGASISSDATRCQYCGAKLATVACPSCFGLAFIGSKFCPHCGKELVFPTNVDTSLKCPRCTTASMEAVALKDTNILECSKCCGLWLPVATFDRICNNQEEQSAMLELNLPTPTGSNVEISHHYLPCPKCATLMNRVNFAHRSGVIIDVCKKDGIWFDRDELRHIIEFIRGGGLARAKEIDGEERKDEVRELNSLGNRLSPSSVFQEVHQDEIANAIAVTLDSIGHLFR